jgi:hypothetical protein
MDQTFVNFLLGGLTLLASGLARLGYSSLMERIKKLETTVEQMPNVYVRRDEFSAAVNRIESATNRMEARQDVVLSRIEARLDQKADKE